MFETIVHDLFSLGKGYFYFAFFSRNINRHLKIILSENIKASKGFTVQRRLKILSDFFFCTHIPVQTSCDEYKYSFWPRTIND